jgi:hypothetical protein
MVAAVLIETVAQTSNGQAADSSQNTLSSLLIPAEARATLAVIPRLSSMPRADNIPLAPGTTLRANSGPDEAVLANDRVQVRVLAGERRSPLLILAAKEGNGWRTVATGTPLIEVNAGEEGQLPWWETFRWKETRTSHEKTSASLTLTGEIGRRWRAELTLEVKPGTAALDGNLRVTPLRTLRLYGVRLPRLLPVNREGTTLKPDGSALSVIQNEPILPEDTRVRALRSDGITFGITWPAAPPLADWEWTSATPYNTNLLSVLGAEWTGPDAGGIIQPGASVTFPFRLFAFGPSDSLKDALRFMPP